MKGKKGAQSSFLSPLMKEKRRKISKKKEEGKTFRTRPEPSGVQKRNDDPGEISNLGKEKRQPCDPRGLEGLGGESTESTTAGREA